MILEPSSYYSQQSIFSQSAPTIWGSEMGCRWKKKTMKILSALGDMDGKVHSFISYEECNWKPSSMITGEIKSV